jgi:hypothetical protein
MTERGELHIAHVVGATVVSNQTFDNTEQGRFDWAFQWLLAQGKRPTPTLLNELMQHGGRTNNLNGRLTARYQENMRAAGYVLYWRPTGGRRWVAPGETAPEGWTQVPVP